MKLLKKLGEGGFGKVMLGVHKRTKQKVALKFIKSTMQCFINFFFFNLLYFFFIIAIYFHFYS